MGKQLNPRAIKRQIRSVQNLKKITKAMEMVSAAKLRRVQEALLAIRPYADALRALLDKVGAGGGAEKIALLTPRPHCHRRALVVFSADKGLCGSYNSNVLRRASTTLAAKEMETDVYAVGKKACEKLGRKVGLKGKWEGLPVNINFLEAGEIINSVVGAYKRGEVDEVSVIYTEYVNAVTFTPRVIRFLPFAAEAGLKEAGEAPSAGGGELLFEPAPAEIFAQLIPRYVEVRFYRLLMEAMASEHAARMAAMRAATDNAQELIEHLTLTFNKARQASITKELLDIVGGAEALRS